MKVAPVSADLLIKLALGAVAVGVAVYAFKKVTGALGDAAGAPGRAIDYLVSLPGKAIEAVKEIAQEGGAVWQGNTAERPPTEQEFFGKHNGPLVNDDGVDFGQLSG